ncbi:hypothetical protein HNQ80_005196 [Anaerosolibacter carboniphilus]|uniref:Uncharacterized protein n=1 Tax=Anaerosolibacter carboniphilus TaxID=1417629 RepID=A0A841L310_9FIRM|nr:hypothetical protein [Anaerosolibacter carboniphilus]MBB6219018.1 hypothetical protein [Anaerosolibacter carboniphilus]
MVGAKVFIFDQASDLFIKAGEIVDVQGTIALVMIEEIRKDRVICIVDKFDLSKLYFKSKRGVAV